MDRQGSVLGDFLVASLKGRWELSCILSKYYLAMIANSISEDLLNRIEIAVSPWCEVVAALHFLFRLKAADSLPGEEAREEFG